jgi:hypothetical protein
LDSLSSGIFCLTITLSQLEISPLKRNKLACSSNLSMEQKAAMHFFILKRFTHQDNQIELSSMYGPMHLLYRRYTNGTRISLTGEPDSAMIRGQSDACTVISPRSSVPCFRNALLHHARGFVSTSGLQDYVFAHSARCLEF